MTIIATKSAPVDKNDKIGEVKIDTVPLPFDMDQLASENRINVLDTFFRYTLPLYEE